MRTRIKSIPVTSTRDYDLSQVRRLNYLQMAYSVSLPVDNKSNLKPYIKVFGEYKLIKESDLNRIPSDIKIYWRHGAF